MTQAVDGHEVHIRHIRLFQAPNKQGSTVSNKGGATVAYYEAEDGSVFSAIAYCNPEDNFHRVEGRNRSVGRLKSADFVVKQTVDLSQFEEIILNIMGMNLTNNLDLAIELEGSLNFHIPEVYARTFV